MFPQEKLQYSLTAVSGGLQNCNFLITEHFSKGNCRQTRIKEGMENLFPFLSFPPTQEGVRKQSSPTLVSLEDLAGLVFVRRVWDT